MSHRIEYRQVAVIFPLADLKPHQDRLYNDMYLALALGGDNNCTTGHPVTGRGVRARDWLAIAHGHRSDVMEQIVKDAASCEGGMMRLTGDRHTLPESYIRRWRNELAHPIYIADLFKTHGITLECKVQASEQDIADKSWIREAAEIADTLSTPKQANDRRTWSLSLTDTKHAAFLFQHGSGLVQGRSWNAISTDGPRFKGE